MLRITITGDVSFSKIGQYRYGTELLNEFEQSDIVIGNLEAVITNSNKRKFWKSYHLKAEPDKVNLLKPFDAFSMANNHVLDYGKQGLIDTLELLKKNQKRWFGVGTSKSQASHPFTFEKNGVKLVIFGVTHYFCAGILRSHGTDNMNSRDVLKRIVESKKKGYFVIVMPHWGYEHIAYPSPRERELARKFINAGADAVIGSHPHEMQGIEEIRGKIVCYSLGNFIFSSSDFTLADNKKLYESFMIQLKIFEENKYEYKVIPFVTSDTIVDLADKEKAEDILSSVNLISEPLKSSNYEIIFYDNMYKKYVQKRSNEFKCRRSERKKSGVFIKIKLIILTLLNVDRQFIKIALYVLNRKYLKSSTTAF